MVTRMGYSKAGVRRRFNECNPPSAVVFPCAVQVSELLSESGELFMVTVTENDPQGAYASHWVAAGQRERRERTQPGSVLVPGPYGCVDSLV